MSEFMMVGQRLRAIEFDGLGYLLFFQKIHTLPQLFDRFIQYIGQYRSIFSETILPNYLNRLSFISLLLYMIFLICLNRNSMLIIKNIECYMNNLNNMRYAFVYSLFDHSIFHSISMVQQISGCSGCGPSFSH